MIKKMLKFTLVCLMIVGVTFSLFNFTQNSVNAKDGGGGGHWVDEQLYTSGDPDSPFFVWWCDGAGQGCHTWTNEE